jgi:hypothetical protein
MNKTENKIGVYCLANDEVLEWFQGFVRSFRKFNPTLPLTIIPYNTAMARLKTLQAQYNFTVMAEATACRFDVVAPRVAGLKIAGGTFRKLCCFFGEYDTFLFLDSDIVVTSRLEPLLRLFETVTGDFVYFDTDISMVYTPEFARKMVMEYGSPGFTSGSWLARHGILSETEIMAAVESGEKVRDGFAIWGEQPFLNYLLDVSRCTRLPIGAILREASNLPWANTILRPDPLNGGYLDAARRPTPFLHWPGSEWPTMPRPEIFLRFRTLGLGGGERLGYRLYFYYRRWRANLKATLQNSPWFAGWVARREARLRKKAKPKPDET